VKETIRARAISHADCEPSDQESMKCGEWCHQEGKAASDVQIIS
jgi:hypothetical protein